MTSRQKSCPDSDEPKLPVAFVKVKYRRRTKDYELEVVCCPFCGDHHYHGGGDDRKNLILGSRCSHCGGGEYELVVQKRPRYRW